MSETGEALERLEQAVDTLEKRLAQALAGGAGGDAELEAENAALREAAARDAELRHEATAAVKAALDDLRALMPKEARNG
ncbi:MAG: hypothetical protein AAGC57_00945 [Pseudomonadota bacterium]